MTSRFGAFNPMTRLRPRMALLVFGGIGLLAFFLAQQSTSTLTRTYHERGRSELRAIAGTWDDGFRGTDLSRPKLLQRRIENIKANNPALHKISVSWYDRAGQTLLVSAGHEHDSNGAKRDVTTAEVQRSGKNSKPAPIDEGAYGYREVRAPEAHYGELNYPVLRGEETRPRAALELHYDLKALDAALRYEQRVLVIAAVLAALTLSLLVTLLLGRTVLTPLDQLREATNRVRSGDRATRLGWRRRDEMGELAADFDRMAEELQEARKDPLTGLLNHRAFQERLGEELRRAERERYSVAIIAIDLDDFKRINDAWGHACGDDALRVLADLLGTQLRPSDISGRVGGDEFMVALPRADSTAAQEVVARLRAKAASILVGPARQPLAISAGIAEFPRHSLAQEELLHLADGAMYWAKTTGKDRSFIYSADANLALSPAEAAERNLKQGLVNTVHALAAAVDAKDGYTHSHSRRVAHYAGTLAEALGLEPARLEEVRTAGVLHDVGKIGISDTILLLARKLSPDEFAILRRHSELGRDIIAGAGMPEVADWVLHLHERVDGRGYPDGLVGEEIPIECRVLHCADALEAMTSSRVYRAALPLEVALEELERGMGTQFDAAVARVLIDLVRSGQINVDGGETAAETARAPSREAILN